MNERPAADGALEVTTGQEVASSIPPATPKNADTDVTRVTAMTPAERSQAYRKRKRDGTTAHLLDPQAVTTVTPPVTPEPVAPPAGLSRRDRDDLAKLARHRSRLAKAGVAAVAAELLADVESKLAAEFSSRDAMWSEATQLARQAVADANAVVQQMCEERGIPKDLRPSIEVGWRSRGANTTPARRAELRKVAQARIEHMSRTAKLAIEAQEVETVAALLTGGLDSSAAREFLDRMPDPRTLMPQLEVGDLEGDR